jgi:hypothetical protein
LLTVTLNGDAVRNQTCIPVTLSCDVT